MNEFVLIWFLVRIIGAIFCSNKAIEKNRTAWVWGFFGFLFPLITIVCIVSVPYETKWEKES
jgi:hypothetical protein